MVLSPLHSMPIRLAPVLLGMLLAACSAEPAPTGAPPLPVLDSFVVGAPTAGDGRAWDGVVEAVQQADLAAQTAGRVASVAVDAGDRVRSGQVLLRLTAVEQQAGASAARAQLRANEAAAAEAEANYARYESLGQRQYVSRLQLDQARAARDAAVANRDAARAQLAQAAQQADYTTVRAPFDGLVSARRVEPGESVVPGRALLSMHAPDALRIEVALPQTAAAAVRRAAAAEVVLGDGRRIAATRVTVFPAADAATHTVSVRVDLPTLDDAPAPGTTAKVLFPIATGAGPAPMRIPRSAVVQRGELSAAYVLDGPRLALRQLRLGGERGTQVEVLSGLKPGDRVASDPVAAGQALAAQRKVADARHD